MNSNDKRIYAFGPYHLDTAEHLLKKDEQIVPLPPKVIDTLSILVENRGRVISKDELMQTLWPDIFVEESNLTHNISQIRRALSEGSPDIKYIETIPKRGYRFTADVRNYVSTTTIKTNEIILSEQFFETVSSETEPFATYVIPSNVSKIENKTDSISLILISLKKKMPALISITAAISILSFTIYIALNKRSMNYESLLQNPQFIKLTNSGNIAASAVSNDGKYIVYVTNNAGLQNLHIRQIEGSTDIQVTQPEDIRYSYLEFSPDDQFIYYISRRNGESSRDLYRVPLLGGISKKMLASINSTITLSPDGSRIAYVREEAGQLATTLIVTDIEGGGERKLVLKTRPEQFSMRAIAWSPDGKYIAVGLMNLAGTESTTQISLINPVNGEENSILKGSWNDMGKLSWMPDSKGLIFNAGRVESGVYSEPLWLVTIDDKKVNRLTNENTTYIAVDTSLRNNIISALQIDRVSRLSIFTLSAADYKENESIVLDLGITPHFSQDLDLNWASQNKLVYGSQRSDNVDIWMLDINGKNKTQLTNEPRTDNYAVVTPDSRYIVFLSDRSGHSNIWRMDMDGNNPKQLTNGISHINPVITPDSKTIIYSSWTNNVYNLWKVPVEGGQAVKLSNVRLKNFEISPDGRLLAGVHPNKNTSGNNIVTLTIEGGEPKIINNIHSPDFSTVKWSPDGKALTYSRTIKGVSNIWSSPIDGGEPKQLTSFTSDRIFRFAWSPDGKQLACERGVTITDVVIIR